MFCNQCEQTPIGGCTEIGICGKSEDLASWQDILILSVKGLSSYAYHANKLGYTSKDVDNFVHEALFSTGTNVNFNTQRLINLCLKAGEVCFRAMELLDKALVEKFGAPELTEVTVGTVAGPGILVTGHDLLDLYELLKKSEGRGVNIYTHGEMLSAHGYPELKKYKHLVGHFGGSWVDQKKVFDSFPGTILGTANCVVQPKDSYKNRMFTCGIAGLEGVNHISDNNFEPVIKKALELPKLSAQDGPKLTVGIHHSNFLVDLAPKIVELLKTGKIKHIFIIAGCDCTSNDMEYYRELTKAIPENCLIWSLACGKFRFNSVDYGSIDGIPRFMDLGQCNNTYSAILMALALAEILPPSIPIPLSIILSWFEQKAVAIFFTLFFVGIANIRIGPKAPAFFPEGVFKILQDTFDLKYITDPKEDLEACLHAWYSYAARA